MAIRFMAYVDAANNARHWVMQAASELFENACTSVILKLNFVFLDCLKQRLD
jgi:hypothetical protein